MTSCLRWSLIFFIASGSSLTATLSDQTLNKFSKRAVFDILTAQCCPSSDKVLPHPLQAILELRKPFASRFQEIPSQITFLDLEVCISRKIGQIIGLQFLPVWWRTLSFPKFRWDFFDFHNVINSFSKKGITCIFKFYFFHFSYAKKTNFLLSYNFSCIVFALFFIKLWFWNKKSKVELHVLQNFY